MNYTNEVKGIIAQMSGAEPADIIEEAYFEDDLNIGALELKEIIEAIEEQYELSLREEDDPDIETVGDIIHILNEKLD